MEERPEILLSATQVSLFQECARKWGFKYLDRIPDPPKPGALLGTEVQDMQIDPWLSEGRGFDFSRPSGEIANALAPLLPKPGAPGMRLRRKFRMPSPSGLFAWQGEFDLWGEDSSIVPGLTGGRPLLGDIKTTKDLKYAKTKADLLTDIQCQLYAADIMFAEEGADELDAVWWYARTQRPHKVQRVHVHLKAADVAEEFAKIDAVGCEVRTIKLARPKVDDLQPNPRMCGAYGGCPYRSICNLSPASFASAWNDEEKESMGSTNDFLAGLRKQVGMQTAPLALTVGPAIAAQGAQAETLPSWATAPVDPRAASASQKTWTMPGTPAMPATATVPPAINPPETELPPAPPTGGVAEALPAAVEAKPKRGRPRKDAQPPGLLSKEGEAAQAAGKEIGPVCAPAEVQEAFIAAFPSFPKAEAAAFFKALSVWMTEAP